MADEPASGRAAVQPTPPAAAQEPEADTSTLAIRKDEVVAQAKEAAERGKRLKAWWEGTSWAKGLKRFSLQNGNVLSAGIAYFSLASVAAGLVVATTLATLFLAGNDDLRTSLVEYLGQSVPGLVQTGPDSPGIIQPDDLGTASSTSIAGIVGLVSFLILINTATRFIAGLRTSIRTMLGEESSSPVVGKLRDVGALFGLLIIALVGLTIQVVATTAAEWVAEAIDVAVPWWGVRLIGFGAGMVADMLYVALALIVLGGAAWSRRLLAILLVASFAIGVLRVGVSLVVSGSTENRVLAPFAAIITLMVFVDYVNRIILMCAAWLGAHHVAPEVGRIHYAAVPEDVAHVDQVAGRRGRHTKVTTTRATVRRKPGQAPVRESHV
ncbi:YihY/virulence factor BrkB family protein [Demequina zhanjiangensis]|uniref:YihY/virulence factor BrkB family protein n=1 Tax=Demequina zhanjiangensis TaxID=3051659 RepID=A0ABT8G149_9MICO|nr:YihY/virulence factor BrkB family protein [Demequina sp. SYSU T00b26]MDN4472812.1 YihY/virulence factor BrkB family protein [Demequina sp. SYSU T00b26]